MGRMADVAEFLTRSGYGSVSGNAMLTHQPLLTRLHPGSCTLASARGVPKACQWLIDWLPGRGVAQESEGEEAEQSRVELPEEAGAKAQARQSRIRLYEVGWQAAVHPTAGLYKLQPPDRRAAALLMLNSPFLCLLPTFRAMPEWSRLAPALSWR